MIFLTPVFFCLAVALASVADLTANADRLRARGKFSDALAEYSKALRQDPDNYLVLFKRGAAYMGMDGKELAAISDFSKVLAIRPGFEGALTQRAKLELKLGDLDAALRDAEQIAMGKAEGIKKDVEETKLSIEGARKALEAGALEECTQVATRGLKLSTGNAQLRLIREQCHLKSGNIRGALVDLSSLEAYGAKKERFESYVKSAKLLYYVFHEYDNALSHIQRCLRFDMDNKPCQNAFREIKQFEKKTGGSFAGLPSAEKEFPATHKVWAQAIALATEEKVDEIRNSVKEAYKELGLALDAETHSSLVMGLDETLCVAFYNAKKYKNPMAAKYCDRVLAREHPNSPAVNAEIKAHLLKVEGLIEDGDDFDAALAELNKALEIHADHPQLTAKVHEVQMLAQRAKSKDYYKVLGLARSATDREIRAAYREKSRQYHPDKYRGDMTPDQVDRKMAEVNEAYEVLSTPELKARFDRGDDPNSTDQPQQHAHHHQHAGGPFQHQFRGGQHGGGGMNQEDIFKMFFRQQQAQQQGQHRQQQPPRQKRGRRP